MNTKPFRRSQSAKHRSTSSTFISLHFNKADEDQLEISYKDEKKTDDLMTKVASETPQSNSTLYIQDVKKSTESLSESYVKENFDKEESTSSSDSALRSYFSHKKTHALSPNEGFIEETLKGKFSKITEGIKNEECHKSEWSEPKQEVEQNVVINSSLSDNLSKVKDEILEKLSPAIEAAELEGSDFFNKYINDELEKAKCEILDLKKDLSSSFISVSDSKKKESSSSVDKKNLEISREQSESKREKLHTKESSFLNILQKSVDFLNFARNNVKFHILVAVIACLCAPIPSWLSGFLVGTILSSCLVYWLYKPPKNKKQFYNFNFLQPQNVEVAKFQDDSGILKGWMNELPSFMSYSPDRYHISCTRSVYVRLDGSYLRFSFPLRNIPKRAMFNEPRHDMQFIYQQHYDIADAAVELLPKGLSNKRLWSKKYPICLRISNSKEAVLSNASKTGVVEAPFSSKSSKKENLSKKFVPRINENNEIVIYLFSRTDRDKSVWYYRFKKASKLKMARANSPTLFSRVSENDSNLENKRTRSVDFAFLQMHSFANSEEPVLGETDDQFVEISLNKQQKFEMYMSLLMAPLHGDHLFSMSPLKKDEKTVSKAGSSPSNLTWLNVLIGRLFFDFLIEDEWAKLVTEKIQKKLNRIKLPFFLTELTVKDIYLGSALPKIHRASEPTIDEKGLWVDVDLSYNGSFHMTLETKLSLRRLKGDSEEFWSSLSEVSKENEILEQPMKTFADSDEDSLESSSDEEAYIPELNEENALKESSVPSSGGSTSKKLMKFVDRLAQSSYFQHAAKTKFVKKAMEDISNTPLVLTVEVQWLTGTLAINIPPWPTDRLWYGFRKNPSLSITARPKLGQHAVTFTQVTEWIEKKLVSEFQKLLVMPNMDDLIIPIMNSSADIPDA